MLGGFTQSNLNIDETILRTVGRLACLSDQVAATENQIGAFGIIAVTDLAFAAGAASIPGPVTDGGDDGWFLFVPIAQSFGFSSAVGLMPQLATGYDFDSKAKRRVEEGTTLALMVENASSAEAFNVFVVLRLLAMVSGT